MGGGRGRGGGRTFRIITIVASVCLSSLKKKKKDETKYVNHETKIFNACAHRREQIVFLIIIIII